MVLPLIGGTLNYFVKSNKGFYLSILFVLGGLVQAIRLQFLDHISLRWDWIPMMELGFKVDHLSALLIGLVYFVSLLVHVFAIHYMHGEVDIKRFYFKLGFFTSAMLGLLASDHLLLMFVFWELVGFSSYLLIGFWFTDSDKATSARTAFMVNRVADFGLLIGIILLMYVFDVRYFSELSEISNATGLLTFAGIMVALGAFGKSAQFPFFGWLNKAMAGPTPVSALIHAATMVTAGVYLLTRLAPVLTETTMLVVAIVGATTALMAGISALFQYDIKAVLAYSTISQLGYMIMGAGVGAYDASVFHLWTHAFFKAGLFLAAGNVIHYYHKANHHLDAQDMRNMGGAKSKLPLTFLVYVICGAALAGLPFSAGFLSKEGLLTATLDWGFEGGHFSILKSWVILASFATALLTPFYISRQIFIVFFGNNRAEVSSDAHHDAEPLLTVKLPLILLSIGALWVAHSVNPFNAHGWHLSQWLFGASEFHSHHATIVLISSVVLVSVGIGAAVMIYRKGSWSSFEGAKESDYAFLRDGWRIQKLYDYSNVSFVGFARMCAWVDKNVIDYIVNAVGVASIVLAKTSWLIDKYFIDGAVLGAGKLSKSVGKLTNKIQSPSIQDQLLFMLLVLVLIFFWFLF